MLPPAVGPAAVDGCCRRVDSPTSGR